MTTLPNANIVLPTRGAPGSGLWADAIDAALTIIDGMDHTPGKGPRIPTAGININGDLTFSSLYAPTNLARLSFASITALSSNNKSLFVSSADNELYWRSNAGTNVKMTLAGALNVAAFTGGIGGDYAAVGAAVAFDDAGDRYTFKQQSPGNWARLASGDVRLFETGTTESVFVGLAAPAALAGSYTITMPLAAPGSTSLVQMDSSGVLTASNTTIGGTPNFTGAVTMASTLGVTGLATVGGTLGVTGLITATAGVTAAANQHVTVSGTGLFKHGTKTLSIHGCYFQANTPGYTNASTLGIALSSAGTSVTCFASINLPVGSRILNVRAFVLDNATGPTKLQATIFSLSSTGVSTSAASGLSSGAGANQTLTISPSSAVLASTGFMVQVAITTGTATCNVYCAEIDYDQP